MKNIKFANIIIGLLLGAIVGNVIEATPAFGIPVNSVSEIAAKIAEWPMGPLYLIEDVKSNNFYVSPVEIYDEHDCYYGSPSMVLAIDHTQIVELMELIKDRHFLTAEMKPYTISQ